MRPAATRYGCVNAAWQLGGDAALLTTAAQVFDVLVVVEARTGDNRPLDVGGILGKDWKVYQRLGSASLSGTAIAVRKGAGVRVRRWRSFLAAAGNSEVQARYLQQLLIDDVDGRVRLGGIHIPLESSGQHDDGVQAAREFIQRARRAEHRATLRGRPVPRWLLLGDTNEGHASLARKLDVKRSDGADVMSALWSVRWGRVEVRGWRAAFTDHHLLGFHRVRG